MELTVASLLSLVCEELPVDCSRIYFLGSSSGGYGVLRLAELLPALPAAVVPMAGYYPEIPREDHKAAVLVQRLEAIPCVWPLHCCWDTLCHPELPQVKRVY